MNPDPRPVHHGRRLRAAFVLAAILCLAVPAGAQAFDTGPHSDLTRDALTAEGFSTTATDVAQVENWFVDLYSNASKIPQSGHASIGVGLVGSLLGPRENWPDAVVTAATRLHFDSQIWDVANVGKAQIEWERLQRATSQALRSIKSSGGANKELQLLAVIGIGLHAVQDFYSHSNWIEQQGVPGIDGTDWSKLTVGLTPTWFDVPKATRDTLNVYIGDSTGHKVRVHGGWNTDGNTSMAHGVNKDWPGRPGYTDAYTTSYFASRQWVRAIHAALGDEALWSRASRYADRKSGQLDHDLKGALKIGMMTGHWQGQGEPCNPSFSLKVCGDRNGLGGDLIGARNAMRDYFDVDRTSYRGIFEGIILLMAQPDPNGDLLPTTSSQPLQATTRFVKLQVTSMKGVGLRALGDPTPFDQADMFSRATIAGQRFQSGEINGRDSFRFPRPYAPFTFIKAIPAGSTYAEPVTRMTVEIRTSSKLFAGTDDDVFLRLGPNLRFPLDKRLYDDFERGDRDTYSVPIDDAVRAGLTVGDITRVQIDKSPDGVGGGWRLRGVKLSVNGRTIYAKDGIERWLEDDHRTWRAPDFTRTAPSGAAVPVTLDLWDEDSFIYGADDHGDINFYDARKRLALGYVPGTSAAARATGGSALGGRIGDGDKASLTYTIQTLTPTTAAPPPPPPRVVEPPPPPPPPPPAPKADLVISALDYDPVAKYFFTVTNQGAGAAGAFTVDVPGRGSFAFAGLAAGASAKQTFSSLDCLNASVQATADALGQVAESDETNNSRSFDFVCIL